MILTWLSENQLVWELLLIPLVTFVVTWLFKPRTEVEYAALHPRIAALLKLVAALGIDAPKLADALVQLARGRVRTVAEERTKQRGATSLESVSFAVLFCAGCMIFALDVSCALSGCQPSHAVTAIDVSAYAAKLEACATSSNTCVEYIECRHAVQRSEGVPETGSCTPDGGSQ